MEHCSVIERNEAVIHATGMNLGNTVHCMRESRHKRANAVWFHWYGMCRISQSTETESKLSVCQGWGERRLGRPANRHGVSFGDDGNDPGFISEESS